MPHRTLTDFAEFSRYWRTKVVVPNIVGMSQVDAEMAIINAGLVTGKVSISFSETIPHGYIISQYPSLDMIVQRGTAMNFTISSPPTVAYWRFEEGEPDMQVSHGGLPDGVHYPAVYDHSGNGYALSVCAEGWAGYTYKTDVAGTTVNGLINNYSVKNSGEHPVMFTATNTGIQTMSPASFTIEATFRLENTDNRHATIVGRDSRGSTAIDGDLAALYFQGTPNNGLSIKFCDVSGYWHEATTPENAFIGFDWSVNPDGHDTPWYSMAAVSDGTILSLYLRNVTEKQDWQLVAQTDMTLSGSPDSS